MTTKQLAVLRYIYGFQAAHDGVSPSFRELEAAGVHKVNAAEILDRLQEDGCVRWLKRRARAIEVLRPVPVPRAPDSAALYAVPIALNAGKV